MSHLTLICLLVFGLCACDQQQPASDRSVLLPVADKPVAQADVKLSYNRDIRPILSDKCFSCHGPDSAARAADLRLDTPDNGEDYDGAYFAIEPGDPQASELVSRIFSTKPKVVMPPPSFKVELTDEEKAKLVRWIQEGAQYEAHWSFVPLADQVALPEVQNEAWVRDPIDRFVLARLEAERLSPTNEATRERWLRRVTYDLTGLPPRVQDIDAFLSDDSPQAYEKVVDRLLASPAYGERMAVPWLDMARYADTYGYTVDGFRAAWPWRDWVVKAFNDNLPYDQFLTWQLAGDLLPDASGDQQLATAFNRLHRMNAEGGAIAEEWRIEGVADRLHTFGTAFMGMTFECARCHDHRYDPISQENYYELFAFFNSIDESGTTEFKRPDIVPPPSMLLPDEAQRIKLAALKAEVAAAERTLARDIEQSLAGFEAWREAMPDKLAIPDVIGQFDFDAAENNKLINRTNAEQSGQIGQHESTRAPMIVDGVKGSALRFDGDNYASLPGMEDLDRWTPFSVSLWLKVDKLEAGTPRVIAKRTSGTDVGPYGFDLMLDGGRIMARAYRHWPGNAIGIHTGDVVEAGQWVHIVWRYDGSSRASGLSLVINGVPTKSEILRDGPMLKTIGGGNPYGPGGKNLILGQRFRDRGLSGGAIDEVTLVRRAVSDVEAKHLYDGKALDQAIANQDNGELFSYYVQAVDPAPRKGCGDLEAKRKAVVQHESAIPEIAVMRELPEPRPSHILDRGLYNAERTPENLVSRDVPESVLPWDEALPRNRLGLAKWLTKPEHPLTARLAVNRLWQQCFGVGLVPTVDNLGLQGALPTHPELLDHLAISYIASGWDTKAMLKRIVLSATYRQDSATSPDQWKSNPDNALLSRGPARRLDAEMIRDTALSASGLLVNKPGGPPAYPYQPEGLWKEVNGESYRIGQGESLYRRSMYTVWKRAVPMPNMMAFDTPTREACTAARSATNTPLQALVLLNDVQYVEAARTLAQRVMQEVQGDEPRITLGFQMLTGRQPTATEATRLMELLNAQRVLFNSDEQSALDLLQMGASPRDEQLDANEHAALAVVMHAIFNLDATIWRR